MNLTEAIINQNYTVKNLVTTDAALMRRYFQLGIYPGVKIVLLRKAPLFKDPLIFEIGESMHVVMTKAEAAFIEVMETN